MRPLALSFLCALALVAPVQAQDPQVDPGSPAGTEYQLPVDRAREEAGSDGGAGGPGNSQDGGTTTRAPLFGSGVESRKSSSAGKSGTESERATVAGVESDATPEKVRAEVPASDGGGGALVAVGGGAIGVLLLGGLAGLAWRRRSGSS